MSRHRDHDHDVYHFDSTPTRLDALRALLDSPVPEGEPTIQPPVLTQPGDPDRHRMLGRLPRGLSLPFRRPRKTAVAGGR